MGTLSQDAVAHLESERAETLRTLLGLGDADCRTPVEWYGRKQTVGHMLRLFTSHSLDHFQHLHRLLQDRGRKFTEAQLLLMKAHAAQAEFEALVLSLSDEEFLQTGPGEEDWSAAQILEHVMQSERNYREAIRGAFAADAEPGRAPATGCS
jgi:hypothetical protein